MYLHDKSKKTKQQQRIREVTVWIQVLIQVDSTIKAQVELKDRQTFGETDRQQSKTETLHARTQSTDFLKFYFWTSGAVGTSTGTSCWHQLKDELWGEPQELLLLRLFCGKYTKKGHASLPENVNKERKGIAVWCRTAALGLELQRGTSLRRGKPLQRVCIKISSCHKDQATMLQTRQETRRLRFSTRSNNWLIQPWYCK